MEDWKERKAVLVGQGNTVVLRPIPKLDDDIVPRKTKCKGGRQKLWTPARMKGAVNKYFEWCEKEDELPSIKGLMIHLKMYRDTFYTYLKYEGFTNIMEHARMMIANWAETDVYHTGGMAAGKIQYMKNIHGWTEKLETNNFSETRIITPEIARAKIEMLAPKLLEALKHSEVLKQITHRDVIEAEEVPTKARRI